MATTPTAQQALARSQALARTARLERAKTQEAQPTFQEPNPFDQQVAAGEMMLALAQRRQQLYAYLRSLPDEPRPREADDIASRFSERYGSSYGFDAAELVRINGDLADMEALYYAAYPHRFVT